MKINKHILYNEAIPLIIVISIVVNMHWVNPETDLFNWKVKGFLVIIVILVFFLKWQLEKWFVKEKEILPKKLYITTISELIQSITIMAGAIIVVLLLVRYVVVPFIFRFIL